MDDHIERQLPIDIALDKDKDHIYSGICIKSNRYLFILVTFDYDSGEFDGFEVFRNKDVVCYRLWDDDDHSELKNDNFLDFLPLVDLSKMNTICSALKEASKHGLISFYTDVYDDECYVGELQHVDRMNATFTLISAEKEWLDTRTFPIRDIAYFGFASAYEKELLS